MKKFVSLSIGSKIFVAFVVLQLIAVAVLTISEIVALPLWKVSLIDSLFWSFILLLTIGMVEWMFITLLIDMVINKN